MPKVRYPVLVREQKAAVMRVRHVQMNSKPYAFSYREEEGVTISGNMTDIFLRRVVVEGFENFKNISMEFSGSVTTASLFGSVVDYFYPDPITGESWAFSGSITTASLYGAVVDYIHPDTIVGESGEGWTFSGSVTTASLYGNVIDTVQEERPGDHTFMSGQVIGATLT
jgi:hypothetical protein